MNSIPQVLIEYWIIHIAITLPSYSILITVTFVKVVIYVDGRWWSTRPFVCHYRADDDDDDGDENELIECFFFQLLPKPECFVVEEQRTQRV